MIFKATLFIIADELKMSTLKILPLSTKIVLHHFIRYILKAQGCTKQEKNTPTEEEVLIGKKVQTDRGRMGTGPSI